jgi:hypothetical protein
MGWFMSPTQEDLIREHAKASHILVMLDEDEAGQEKRFIEAWKRARIIVDTGGGHSGTPPTPPTPPATPKP